MEPIIDQSRPDTSRSSRVDILRSTINNFKSKARKSHKSSEPEFLVKGKKFSTTTNSFRPAAKEGLSLDQFFGSGFKVLKMDEKKANVNEFNSISNQIADLRENSEEERYRLRRNNFEINETDEDLCTESNIGSSMNASRLGNRIGMQIEEQKMPVIARNKHYRMVDNKNQMYNTSYNSNFFQERVEAGSFKPMENRMKLTKENYFQFHKNRANKKGNNKKSLEISPSSKEIDQSFNDLNLGQGRSRIIPSFSQTNTKGFFQRRNSKEKNSVNSKTNLNSNSHITKRNDNRSIFTLLDDHNQEMRRKYGRKNFDIGREIPDESTLIHKYKEKFGLTETEYSDWSSLVQIKTLNRPMNRDSLERAEIFQSKSSLKEIISH